MDKGFEETGKGRKKGGKKAVVEEDDEAKFESEQKKK